MLSPPSASYRVKGNSKLRGFFFHVQFSYIASGAAVKNLEDSELRLLARFPHLSGRVARPTEIGCARRSNGEGGARHARLIKLN